MELEFALAYRRLYERHWWFRAREELLVRTLGRHAPPGGYGAILDVGCGDALFLDELARFGAPEGLEVEERLLTPASRERWTIHTRPFDDGFEPGRRYGLLSMLDVLEHLPDDAAALRRAHDLLEPGGTLLLTAPALPWLWTQHDERSHHHRRYRRVELAGRVERAGFELVELRHFFHWLVPVKLAVRAKEALVGPGSSGPGLPPGGLNATFLALSRVEQWLPLPRGLGGSSLLAVARRLPLPLEDSV